MSEIGIRSVLFSTKPTLLVEGKKVAELSEELLTLSITESTDGLFRCEASFNNWNSNTGGVGFLFFDRDVLDFGKLLKIEIGDGRARTTLFEGRITRLDGHYPQQGTPELKVHAEDRLQDFRMTRRTRSFEDTSDVHVFEQIANDHGLQADIDVDGLNYSTLTQVNQSDVAFLRERARAIDAEIWVDDESLFAQARSRRKAAVDVRLTYGRELREFEVAADLAQQRSSVVVSGWDVSTKKGISEEAGEAAISSELNGGLSGSSVLADAFGEFPEHIVHDVPLTTDEAQLVAESDYRSLARRFLCGEAVAEGDARIKVSTHVLLGGLGPLFDGTYYVSKVNHTFDGKNGFLSRLWVERPNLGVG